jgi:hypothetical protein
MKIEISLKSIWTRYKKGIHLLIFATLSLLLFDSCSDDYAGVKSQVKLDLDEYIQQKLAEIKASNKKTVVEHATLEEINAVMKAHGMPEFTQEDIENAKKSLQVRTTWDCDIWLEFGDYNDNDSFNTIDLVLAQDFICDYPSNGCSGTIQMITCYICDVEHTNFAYLSYFRNGSGENQLNEDDLDAGRDFILGIVACN